MASFWDFLKSFKSKPKVAKTHYEYALDEVGTWEWKDGDNPKIVQWAKDIGLSWVTDDEVPWCATFLGAMLKKGGIKGTGKPNARSYLDWGTPVDLGNAKPGDVVVFYRGDPKGWQGHVAFYVSHSKDHINVLGGNQSDQVNVTPYRRSKLLGIRRK